MAWVKAMSDVFQDFYSTIETINTISRMVFRHACSKTSIVQLKPVSGVRPSARDMSSKTSIVQLKPDTSSPVHWKLLKFQDFYSTIETMCEKTQKNQKGVFQDFYSTIETPVGN